MAKGNSKGKTADKGKAPATKAKPVPLTKAQQKEQKKAKALTDAQRKALAEEETRQLASKIAQEEQDEMDDDPEADDDDEEGPSSDKDGWKVNLDDGLVPPEESDSDEDDVKEADLSAPPPPPTSDIEDDVAAPVTIDVTTQNTTPPRRRKKKRSASPSAQRPAKRARTAPIDISSDIEAPPTPTPAKRRRRRKGKSSKQGDANTDANGSSRVTESMFTDDEVVLSKGLKGALRAHIVLFNAYPSYGLAKAPYCTPIFEAFVNSGFAPANFKQILADLMKRPMLYEAMCCMVAHSAPEVLRKPLDQFRMKVSRFGIPGPAPFDKEAIETRVAFQRRHKAFHYGEMDPIKMTYDADTPYEAVWLAEFLQGILYNNNSGLDSFLIWRLKELGGMTAEMYGIGLTLMFHCISEWETGTHQEASFTAKGHSGNYIGFVAKFNTYTAVDGWFTELSSACFAMAAKMSNKEWMLKEMASRQEMDKDINFEAIKARTAAKRAARLLQQGVSDDSGGSKEAGPSGTQASSSASGLDF